MLYVDDRIYINPEIIIDVSGRCIVVCYVCIYTFSKWLLAHLLYGICVYHKLPLIILTLHYYPKNDNVMFKCVNVRNRNGSCTPTTV